MGKRKRIWAAVLAGFSLMIFTGASFAGQMVTDSTGRSLALPDKVDRIICSGPGCLRLISYLGARDKVVAVDDIEIRMKKFDARPYALANPSYRDLPVFGGFRGQDDPEKILGLDPSPQVIFKTFAGLGYDPAELQAKTGIPVVVIDYGDLGRKRARLFESLVLMGQVLGKEDRARAVIEFFNREIKGLAGRTRGETEKKNCFVGGIAFKGPHGFRSTEPFYPPFEFVNAVNIAGQGLPPDKEIRHTILSKEKILMADPGVLFLDLSTFQMEEGHSGLYELKTDPVYRALTAVEQDKVYGLLPYNWYTVNFGSVLADAWYIGTVLYPDRFKDIDPGKKADEIYTFLLGTPVFDQMNNLFRQKAFTRIRVSE
ncbi:MAG: iron ABC transporter substrate-binding protein [Desulfobacterales bacterium]|nr:iron ABC transporter substrate-binding protein [Desulfobacterales bacterium]